jgi:hypothetical protein
VPVDIGKWIQSMVALRFNRVSSGATITHRMFFSNLFIFFLYGHSMS